MFMVFFNVFCSDIFLNMNDIMCLDPIYPAPPALLPLAFPSFIHVQAGENGHWLLNENKIDLRV